METNKDIQDKIDSTFEVSNAIQKVTVSPFFKDKTMNILFLEKEEKRQVWSWFTPTWQFATLVCLIVLNVFVYSHLKTDKYELKVTDFASSYGLSVDNDNSIFN